MTDLKVSSCCTLIMVLLAALCLAAQGSEKWMVFTSPTSVYSLEYPGSWRVVREENILNIVVPDESGAVTISAYVGERADLDVVKRQLSAPFKECEVRSPVANESRNGWDGYTQEFSCANQDGPREWIATIAQNGRALVLITANDQSRRMQERKPTYLRILHSLRLLEPMGNRQLQGTSASSVGVDDPFVLRAVIEHTILPQVRRSNSGRSRAEVVLLENRSAALCGSSPCRIPKQ
jgi:hypothetical protein